MAHRPLAVLALSAIVGCGTPTAQPASAGAFPSGAIVDLSHPYGEDTIFWPTAEPFTLDVVSAGETDAGYYYAANNFSTSEHGGTHLDAPVHCARGQHSVDEIPLEQLLGPAVVVDVSAAAAANADYQVTVANLEAFEAAHGRIPDGALLLVRTGFSARWPDAER